MSVIQEALVSLLAADVGVAAILTSGGVTRIYPLVIPEDQTMPAMAYQRISRPQLHSQDGPTGLAWPRFQWTMKAVTETAVIALAEAVRTALDGYVGTVEGVRIDAIFCENEWDAFNPLDKTYEVRLDAVVWHQ